jgi:hypothetical protein
VGIQGSVVNHGRVQKKRLTVMARRCLTCAHPEIAAINQELIENRPYSQISAKFGVGYKSVQRHADLHLKPVIKAVSRETSDQVVKQFLRFRKEVNYAVLDKVKMLQDRILNDLDATSEPDKRVALYRELRGALQEESKLGGYYKQDSKNPADLFEVAKEVVERLVREYGWQEEEARLTIAGMYDLPFAIDAEH